MPRPQFLVTLVALVLISGCDPPATQPPPNTNDNGGANPQEPREVDVSFPGATIIYEGNTHDDEATVPSDALVGVVKDGEAYLYHPALGDADLSHYNSRRAVGYFLAGVARDDSAEKSSPERNLLLVIGESTSLATGAIVERSGETTYTVTNPKKRWLAVKAPAAGKPTFLPARESPVETNILSLLEDRILGDFEPFHSTTIPVNSERVETYGSMARALDPLTMLVFSGQLHDKAQEALAHDATLFIHVNAVDYAVSVFEALEKIASPLIPVECGDLIVTGVLGTFESFFVGVITGDDELRDQFILAMGRDLTQSVVGCACTISSVGVCEVINEFLDIVATLNWVIDDRIIGTIDVLTNAAYADIEGISLDENQAPIVEAGGEQTITWPNDTVDLFAIVTDDGLPAGSNLSETWTADSGPGTVAFSDPGSANTTATFSAPGTYVLTFTVFDGDKTGSDSLVITVSDGGENIPPVADDKSVNVPFNTPATLTLTASDPDNGPSALTYSIVSQPSHGMLSGPPPNVTYTTDAGYSGPDSFTFKASDGAAYSNIATVSITVQDEPQPELKPDLIVNSLTVNGTTLYDGDTLTIAPSTVLNFTQHVANVGDAEAAECRLYTAWGNSFYDLSGFMQGARVGPIPGPGTEDNSDLTGWTAWDTPGTWYITADIDNLDEVTESNENNNMLSIEVVVQDDPEGPDLVVNSLTVNGTTLYDGDTLTIAPSTVLNFTQHVANVGDAEAAECRLYTAWGNSFYDLSGFMQGARVGPIPGPGTEDNSDLTGWTAWDTPGTWYITADIDNLDEVTESNENNNMLSIEVVVEGG